MILIYNLYIGNNNVLLSKSWHDCAVFYSYLFIYGWVVSGPEGVLTEQMDLTALAGIAVLFVCVCDKKSEQKWFLVQSGALLPSRKQKKENNKKYPCQVGNQ